jgi:hypothetical protein
VSSADASGRDVFITAEQVCDLIPGLTIAGLAQMRFRGVGPRYFKPSPRKVVYSRASVLEWLASTERQGTAQAF